MPLTTTLIGTKINMKSVEQKRKEQNTNRHDFELKFRDQLNIFCRMNSLSEILLLYSNFYKFYSLPSKSHLHGFSLQEIENQKNTFYWTKEEEQR